MTQQEKQQISLKFALEIISLLVIFGSIFSTFKLNDYRVTQNEIKLKEHCTWGSEQALILQQNLKINSDQLIKLSVEVAHQTEMLKELSKRKDEGE